MAKTWTSSNGTVVTIRPVSQFKLDNLRSSKKEIPVPTYQVTTVAGDTQEFPLDEEIAKNKDRLPEWQKYVTEKNQNEAIYAKKYFSLLVWDGTDIEPTEKWLTEAEYFGTLPQGETELQTAIKRKVQYIYDEVMMTAEDMNNLMAEILLISKISQEVVDNLRASFRSRVQGKTNKRMAPQKVELEGTRPELGSTGGGEVLEPEAEPVGDLQS